MLPLEYLELLEILGKPLGRFQGTKSLECASVAIDAFIFIVLRHI